MENLAADFTIEFNNPIEAEYELLRSQNFDCSFELFVAYDIEGNGLIDVTKSGGVATITSTTYVHEQGIASDTWVINHNLNKRPSITIVDSADNVVEGAEKYIDNNTIEIYFNGAFKGKAYLN